MNYVKEFLKSLDKIDQSKSRYDVFVDYLELSFNALSKPVSMDEEKAQQREDAYMAVVKRYEDKNNLEAIREHYPKLLTLTVQALEEKFHDFLGTVAGEGEFLNSNLGQFFTPYEVSKLTALMSLGEFEGDLGPKGFLTIDEPACGSGSMMIAASEVLRKEHDVSPVDVWMRGTDLSPQCFKMAYIQAGLCGIAGEIYQGNSLSLEVFDHAYLPVSIHFFAKHGNPYKRRKTVRERSRKIVRNR